MKEMLWSLLQPVLSHQLPLITKRSILVRNQQQFNLPALLIGRKASK